MLKLKSFQRRSWHRFAFPALVAAAVLAFVFGVVWRADFIYFSHPLENYLYSDMKTYASGLQRFYDPSVTLGPGDTIAPPGTGLLFGFFYKLDESWLLVKDLQFFFSVSIPLLIAYIGYLLYRSRAVALVALIISSLYIAFVEYAGFLLSENPYIFFQLVSFLFLALALKAKKKWSGLTLGLLTGLAVGVAASFRSIILLPAFMIMVVLLFFYIRRRQRNILFILLGMVTGTLLLIVPLIERCTRLNDGNFCAISSSSALPVLQGHYGKVGEFKFNDDELGLYSSFASPTSIQKGYEQEAVFPFGPYDSKEVLKAAMSWISDHPAEALKLSFEHVYDLFWGTIPWPSSNTEGRSRIITSEWFFRIFILLPTLIYLLALSRKSLRSKIDHTQADLLILAPLVGIMLVVFLTIAEPRYRIPFDVFFILLAARAYTVGIDRLDSFKKLKEAKFFTRLQV